MSSIAPLNLLSATLVLDTSLIGWTLLDPTHETAGESRRTFRYDVVFSRIVGLDVSNSDNLRVRVRAVDITPNGFALQAETWLNTMIWSVEVSWLAIGA
jgi:H-type lectin domain